MSHAYSRLHYHLVFSTKDRKRLIVPEIKDRLYAYMNGIIRNLGGVVEEIGGVEDHVHLLLFVPPKHSLSDVIRDLKANSSSLVHETWPERAAFAWQRGYGIFSVSESNVEAVHAYIRNQEAHHRKRSFEGFPRLTPWAQGCCRSAAEADALWRSNACLDLGRGAAQALSPQRKLWVIG